MYTCVLNFMYDMFRIFCMCSDVCVCLCMCVCVGGCMYVHECMGVYVVYMSECDVYIM